MSLTAQIDVAVKARVSKTADLSAPSAVVEMLGQFNLANGSGNNQINVIHADSHSMAQSSTKDYDLAGALLNPLGDAAVFAKVKAIAIKAGASNPADLKLGADSAAFAGFFADVSDIVNVPPGEMTILLATKSGKAVAATSADTVQVASPSTTGTYTFDIIFLGTDA